ncbi:FISUMP domain-containing protein [Fibrobacter sp. UWH3]|uniref:FISUMP domain-containing protein n=1 Tax=Fibrobacter sp. UWH3 TaxID=1964353 RepID=UPI0011309193|nr:FISUMP domain-containing protein [Fibrobacter sp. UWH3]
MKRLLPFALALFAATMFFTACGDDDSSSFVEPEKESSSSEILSSGDGTSDGNGDKSSSSVSSSTTNSSSSAKSSSSTGDKNSGGESNPASSSVKSSSSEEGGGDDLDGTSSSSELEDLSCSPEEEGQVLEFTLTGKKYICKNGLLTEIASSSSAVPTSSYFDMTEQFNEKVSYGEFTDPRDGQKYRTVSLYDKVYDITYTIFAENLNYGEMISGGTLQGDSTKYCYDDDPWYCENGWGGLYTWSNAMGFPAICDSVSISDEACSQKFIYPSGQIEPANYVQHQGMCPENWHVMNGNEWAYISESSSRSVAYYMGSKVAGFGSNNYGLSILPAGYWIDYGNEHNKFDEIKVQSQFWMPQQADTDLKAYMTSVSRKNFSRNFPVSKKYGNSIRCVKNY